jgi:hypothetical protein
MKDMTRCLYVSQGFSVEWILDIDDAGDRKNVSGSVREKRKPSGGEELL